MLNQQKDLNFSKNVTQNLDQPQKSTSFILQQKKQQKKQNEIKTQKSNHSLKYKPHIDGLRTIAIFTVVIYHAFPQVLVGGFIGVDVFFVISGYLITGIIVKQSLKNNFSYIDFYSRRIKRIYPALIIMLLGVLVIILIAYLPSQLDFALKTMSASTIFGANLQILSHQKGYFDADVHTNPLLHLWSLGVEEQFYIFWPCLIGLCLSKFQKYTLHGLSIYAAFSFVFGIAAVFINTKFAFYFPLCRFWQMAVGGLISYLNVKLQNKKINEALSIGGTLSILITIWFVNEQSLFPGFWALIPTLAAACIIQAGPQPFINKHILSSKVFVFIGKISYPMYLWHWPLLVFSRYLYPEGSTSILSRVQIILFITLIMSVLTYQFVEKPIRMFTSKKIIIVFLMMMLSIGLCSFKIFYDGNYVQRFYGEVFLGQLIKKAQKQFPPRQQDFVKINGKMHPNFSINKNRQFPTIQKIKFPVWVEEDFWYKHKFILEKKIEQGSKYFLNSKFKQIQSYTVANEGKQNILLLVGDSHIMKLSYRFLQLYEESVKKNTTDSFPTVVAMIKMGYRLDQSNYLFNRTRQFIKVHKPKRILLGCHWVFYLAKLDLHDKENKPPKYKNDSQIKKIYSQFFAFVKQLKHKGIEVSVLTIDMHDSGFDPKYMVDFNGVIEQNIKPVKRSFFRNRYKKIIDQYETKIKKLGVDMIDLTDNLCYQDTCHVISPTGWAILSDNNHYGEMYSRYWMSAVDHLVQF